MSFGYSSRITGSQEYRTTLNGANKVYECQNCHSMAVRAAGDGTFICSVCGAEATDIHEVFDDVDDIMERGGSVRSFRLTQKKDDSAKRENEAVFAEALQLILVSQTIELEKLLKVDLSASVYEYLSSFTRLIRLSNKKNAFQCLLLILHSGLLNIGLPVTHLDIIHWINEEKIPFRNPLSYLPESFYIRLSKAEQKLLTPPIINLNYLTVDFAKEFKEKIHPLPKGELVLWRISSILGLPAGIFTGFMLDLIKKKPFCEITELSLLFNLNTEGKITTKNYKITAFLRIAFATPIAFAVYCLSLIYRLDGTDWVHPMFAARGFPSFKKIVEHVLMTERKDIDFPLAELSKDFPVIHTDFVNECDLGADELPSHIVPIFTNSNAGIGSECEVDYETNTLAEVNNDVRVIISILSRALGISQILIMKQLKKISKRRFGFSLAQKELRASVQHP